MVILDLEDGVAAKDRESRPRGARSTPRSIPTAPSSGSIPLRHADHGLDLEALAKTKYTTVMLAKTEDPQQIRDLAPLDVVVLIETPLGALAVNELARIDNAFAVMWGAEDLFAVTGGTANRWPDGSYRDVAKHVRSQTLLAAKAYGRMALDSVYLDIKDLDGLRGRGRRRRRGRLRRQGRDPPDAGRGHSRRLRARPPSRSSGRDTCSPRPAMNAASSNSKA